MNRFRIWIFIFTILATTKCATLITMSTWHKKNAPVFYSGSRCDIGSIYQEGISKDLIFIFDLPFSIVLDTILVPISLPFAVGMSRWHKQMFQFAPYCYGE